MKVGELIALLSDYPEDLVCLVAQDPEGNGYFSLEDVASAQVKNPDTSRYDTFDIVDDGDAADPNVVILWP